MEGNKEKRLVKYTLQGYPVIENSKGERVCCLEGCHRRSHRRILCKFHLSDGNDYSDYTKTLIKSRNSYKLINNDYYELTVPNSDRVYKISEEDLDFSKSKNWSTLQNNNTYCYLVRSQRTKDRQKTVYFHVEIMKEEIDEYKRVDKMKREPIVDHINGDVTDNRRCNLRVRTQSENNMNKVIVNNNTSGVAGVKWHIRDLVWQAVIDIDNKRLHLGSFYYFRNAVKARIEAEDTYYGEHAFRKRDNEYNEHINYYLGLPEKKEPIFRSRPKIEPFIHGIRKYSSTNENKSYIVSVYDQETRKTINKTFDTLENAMIWKVEKEIKFYGVPVSYIDEKKYKQI